MNDVVSKAFNVFEPASRTASTPKGGGSYLIILGIRVDMASSQATKLEEYLTVAEAAEAVGVCSATMRRWIAGGLISHIRILNTVRIRRRDLDYSLQQIVRRSPLDHRSNVGRPQKRSEGDD